MAVNADTGPGSAARLRAPHRRCLRPLQRRVPRHHAARAAALRRARLEGQPARRRRAHRAVRPLRQPDHRRAARTARAQRPATARCGARSTTSSRAQIAGTGGSGIHQDLLQLDQPPAVRHRRRRAGHRVRGHRPRSAGEHPLRGRHQHLPQPRLAVAAVRGPARRRALPLAVARPRQQHRARRRRGARHLSGARRAARGRRRSR